MTHTGNRRVLIIEDDVALNLLLVEQVAQLGCQAMGAHSRAEALVQITAMSPDAMIVDMRLPDCSGMDLLGEFQDLCPIIVLTAFGTVDDAMRAVRQGASDYLVKPITFQSLEISINRAFDTQELKRDALFWQSQAKRTVETGIIGESAAIQDMHRVIELYAAAGSTVLITGASGTGKELVARAIHDGSNRSTARFVPIDCDPSQENLLVSELFGHERGPFPARKSGAKACWRSRIAARSICRILPKFPPPCKVNCCG